MSGAGSRRQRRDEEFREGVRFLQSGRHRAARKRLVAVVERGTVDAPWAVQELVNSHLRAGEHAAAEDFLRQRVREPALLRHGLGYLYRRLGRRDGARRELEAAWSAQPPCWAAAAELGWMRIQDGDEQGGLALLRRAERRHRRSGDSWGLASALTHLATAAKDEFRLREALELFEDARREKERCGDALGLATCLYGRAQVHHHLLDHESARRDYENARGRWERLRFHLGVAACWNGIGIGWEEIDQSERAADCFRSALRVARRVRPAVPAAHLASYRFNLGRALASAGRHAQGRRHLRAVARDAGAPNEQRAIASVVLALLEDECGRPARALALLEEPLGEGRGELTPATAFHLDVLHARCLRRLGRPEAARQALETARASVRRLADEGPALLLVRLWGRAELAACDTARGRPRAAARAARRIVAESERAVEGTRIADWRAGLRAAWVSLHDVLIEAELATRRPERAWEAAANAKARELRASHRAGPGAAHDELDEVQAELRALRTAERLDRPSRRRLRRLESRHAELCARRPHRLVEGTSDPQAARRDLGRRLGPDGAWIEWHLGCERSFAFVLHERSVRGVELLPSAQETERDLDRLLAPLREIQEAGLLGSVAPAWPGNPLRRLRRRLLEPALEVLPAHVERLFLVPDGPLQALPPALLLEGTRFADGAHATALSALLLRAERVPSGGTLVIGHSPRQASRWQAAGGVVHLEVLRGVHAEARAVTRHWPGARSLTGEEATPEAVLRAMEGASVIHLAAHALANRHAPSQAGLLLDDGTGAAPALLDAGRIARAKLDDAFVILSACETAAGRRTDLEGVQGLARAFFEAGAAAVLATAWPVVDEAAALFADALHEALSRGLSRPAAVARARRALREAPDGRWSNPVHWGAPVLIDHAPRLG